MQAFINIFALLLPFTNMRLTAMTAEYLFIDDSGCRQAIKAIGKSLPQAYIVSTFT